MTMARISKKNIRVYWDDDTNPDNPGYVVAWDTLGSECLTAALDATTRTDARYEAAALLAVELAEIGWED